MRHRPLTLEFDAEAAANDIAVNCHYMAQADESDRETSTQDGEIKSNEDGVATILQQKTTTFRSFEAGGGRCWQGNNPGGENTLMASIGTRSILTV